MVKLHLSHNQKNTEAPPDFVLQTVSGTSRQVPRAISPQIGTPCRVPADGKERNMQGSHILQSLVALV